VRTLHVGLRVADLERSLAFYTAVGYEVVGEVPGSGIGHLVMLKLPDDEFVTVELVAPPAGSDVRAGTGLSHLVVAVGSMAEALAGLASRGVEADPPSSPDGSGDFLTAWITDPDGNRIELVQWPDGHPGGITAADWADR
jgi:lactoylglutathione lyase